MTKEEIIICKMYLEDLDRTHDCNEYKLLMGLLEQQPCDDCVSRAELKKWLDMNFSFGGAIRKIEMFDRIDKELPTVTSTQRWILVSERLPKQFENVNVTCHSLVDKRKDWVVETCYIPQPKNSPYSDWGNIPMLNDGDCEVIAWVHRDIPKPYQAESEE